MDKKKSHGIGKTTVIAIAAALLTAANVAVASIAAPVPEPGPMGLLLLGVVALLVAGRFRRNK